MKPIHSLLGLGLLAAGLALLLARPALSSTVNYTYDGAGRLISAHYSAATNLAYAYDNAGNLLLSSAPAPAILIGSVSAGEVTLSWAALPAGYILQRATALSQPTDWVDVPVTTANIGPLIVATVPAGPGAAFYRLRSGP